MTNSTTATLSPKRRQTRARLIDAAFEVFARVGLGAATIDQIVEEAGFTKGAFYSNFESKTELFVALATRENARRLEQIRAGGSAVAEVLAAAATAPRDDASRRAVVGAIVRAFIGLQNERPEWLVIEQEARLLAMRDSAFAGQLFEYNRALLTELEQIINGLVDSSALCLIIGTGVVVRALAAVFLDTIQREATAPDVAFAARGDELVQVLTDLLFGLSVWAPSA